MQYPESFFAGGSKAYLIGINNYEHVPRLQSTHADCEGLMEVLHSKHKFEVQLEKDVTKAALVALLDTIKNECKQDSRIIFYFAGHGIAEGADDINKRPEGYLLVSDSQRGDTSTYIEMGMVLEVLGKLPCRHLLIILDCCYAGAIKYSMDTRSLGFAVPKTLYQEKFEYYVKEPAKQVITSAAYNQKAVDSLGERGKQINNRSPFADSLIEALSTGDASWTYGNVKPDGIVTSSEIGFFLSLKVSETLTRNNVPFSDQQTPSVFPLTGSDRVVPKGEFIFIDSLDKMLALPKNPKQNPYKGLNAYSEKDNNIFYGRQRVLTGWWEGKVYRPGLLTIVDKNKEQAQADDNREDTYKTYYRVLVSGRSGIGKSSLVKAGVMAKLALSNNKTSIITPGPTPFATHENLLKEINASGTLYYLLIDQYEELITQCNNEEERNKFENTIVQLANEKKAVVIATLRTDIERQFKKSTFLQSDTQNNFYRFIVPNFTRDEIKEIIVQPAAQNLLEFIGKRQEGESNQTEEWINNRFIEKIIDETFANPDSMPMLSETLSRLYEKKEPGSLLLTEENYNDFGGISGILNTKFKEVFESLNDENKKLFRQFIFRMISFDTGYLAKKRVFTSMKNDATEINEIEFSNAEITKAMVNIKEVLQAARLITSSDDKTQQNNIYFEPAHDALLNNTDLVAQWQKEGKEIKSEATPIIPFQSRISVQNALAISARNYYFSTGKDKKGQRWKDDPRFNVVKQLVSKGELQLNKVEEAFIKDSRKAKVLGKRIFYAVAASIFALVLAAAIILIVKNAEVNLEKNNVQNRLAINYLENSEASFNDSDQLNSLLLLAKSVDLNRDTSLNNLMLQRMSFYDQSMLLSSVIKCQSKIIGTELSTNGKFMTLRGDSIVEVWNMNSLEKVYTHREKTQDAFVNDAGSKLYVVTKNNLTALDIRTHKIIRSVSFQAKDSLRVQSATQQNKVLVMEGNYLHQLDSNLIETHPRLHGSDLIVSPDLNYASYVNHLGNQAEVTLSNLNSPYTSTILRRSKLKGCNSAFSNSSKLLAITNGDQLIVRNVQSEATASLKIEPNSARIYFSPDDHHLVVELAEYSNIYNVVNNDRQLAIKKQSTVPVVGLTFCSDRYDGRPFVMNFESATFEVKTGKELGMLDYFYEADIFSDPKNEFELLKFSYDGFLRKMTFGDVRNGMSFAIDTKGLGYVSEQQKFYNNLLVIRRDSILYVYKNSRPQIKPQADAIFCAFSKNGKYSLSINSIGNVELFDVAGNSVRYTNHDLKKKFARAEGVSAIVSDDGDVALFSLKDSGYIFNFKKDKLIRFKRNYFQDFEIIMLNSKNLSSRNVFQTQGYSFIGNSNNIIYRSDSLIYFYDPAKDHVFNKKKIQKNFANNCILLSADGRSYWSLDDSTNILHHIQMFGGNNSTIQIPRKLNGGDRDGTVMKVVPFKTNSALVSKLEMELFLLNNERALNNKKRKNILQIIDAEQKRVIDFMLSPDKKFLVTLCTKGSDESQVHIYRTDTWQKVCVEHFFYSTELQLEHVMSSRFSLRQFYASEDGKQFFVFGPEKVLYINATTKKTITLHFPEYIKYPELSVLTGNYNNGIMRVFDSFSMRTYGTDLDFPPSLFQLQVSVITGAQLNSNNDAEAIPAEELAAKWQDYQKAAAAHLKECKYKEYNLYRQLRDLPIN